MDKKKRKNSSDSSSNDSEDSTELERKQDIKERDDFASRLKAKDKERTKNVAAAKAGVSGKSKFKLLELANLFFIE